MINETIKKFLKREIKYFDESQDEKNNPLNYFRRSRIHWLYLLNILFAYYEKKIITKSDLIHKIQVSHITILKYIKESIELGIIIEERSKFYYMSNFKINCEKLNKNEIVKKILKIYNEN